MVEHSPEPLLGFAWEGVGELEDVPSEFRTGYSESFWQALGCNSCPSLPSTRFWVIWGKEKFSFVCEHLTEEVVRSVGNKNLDNVVFVLKMY